ncbi:PREDICTED: autophagy protein 12-like [Nicrophorus vespilloides]|uniref:Ubiquitin-like protein ATG12 n=1 Tax=Nicrophorus vespilloides TaxID=110193 RepID=A0ABM1N8R5_NICVS|nr:PREDICTED: autophagy protein 12-like [Nicrophorus vespilloides]
MCDNNDTAHNTNINQEDSGTDGESKTEKQKIDILLKPTGNAPIMKKKKWSVESNKPIGWIIDFMKKYLKLEPQERLFLYVNQTFAPSPDQIVKNLYDCYSTEGTLVLHYCKTQAWG